MTNRAQKTKTSLPEGSPRWLTEIEMLRTGAGHYLVTGDISGMQLVPKALFNPSSNGRGFASFENTLRDGLVSMGAHHVIRYDITRGAEVLKSAEGADPVESMVGGPPDAMAPQSSLEGLASLVQAITESRGHVALVIANASRLVRDPEELSEDEFHFFRDIHVDAKRATPLEDGLHYNPILWLLDDNDDLPAWFSLGNATVRRIMVPLPDSDIRLEAAKRKVAMVWPDDAACGTGAESLAAHTTDMSLSQMDAVVRLAEDQGISPADLEDAARAYRVGITENPWKRPYIKERIKSELLGVSRLSERVRGQSVAVGKALDILVRSVSGLTAAHTSGQGTRPRGVLFLAGPTGVGKTELAKSLTELLFDDENAYIRFDMSEFSADHSADRLIGSPPGYVGHTMGGELTNQIRERPFSLLLFDEIEKAHPKILDKFLQILEDGRLTDGRGETVYFSEAVIVFTSNLGIYVEQDVVDPVTGTEATRRVLNVKPEPDMRPEEMHDRVKSEIRDYFQRELGRPELLNRLGDNIVVLDFISPGVAEEILDMMLGNVAERVRQEEGLVLSIADSVRDSLVKSCTNPEVLELGGRGIGSHLESLLVNPLARELFLRRDEFSDAVEVGGLGESNAGQPLVHLREGTLR